VGFDCIFAGGDFGGAAAKDKHDLRGGVRAGGLGLSDRDVRLDSEKISQDEERSGDEQVVFGEERSEVRIEVEDCRVTICFLKRSASGAAILCLCLCLTRYVTPTEDKF
jgi:hypothetical protein